MATKNTENITISKKEYENFQNQLKEMQNIINQFSQQGQPVQNINSYIGNSDRDITLTSLTVGQLNLSTEGYGMGEVYTFNNLGEEQAIPYEDVKKIIKNNKSFIESGKVFINDDEVIKSQKLTNIYKKLLSYDEMLNLFNKDKAAFSKIFKNMTTSQKETLKGIIFDKLENNKSVDMNIVQLLNDDMNIDIMNEFKNKKELFKNLTSEIDN